LSARKRRIWQRFTKSAAQPRRKKLAERAGFAEKVDVTPGPRKRSLFRRKIGVAALAQTVV
jgi:hypothetical protein